MRKICILFAAIILCSMYCTILHAQTNVVIISNEFISKVKQYSSVRGFHEGYAAVCKNNKWGFVDVNGNEVIPCDYTEISDFSDGCAAVAKGNKYGFVDSNGRQIIPCQIVYEPYSVSMASFHDGVVFIPLPANTTITRGSRRERFDEKMYSGWSNDGKMLFDFKYTNYRPFRDGCAPVQAYPKNYGLWGVINKQGQVLVDFRWAEINTFNNGLALAKGNDGKYVFIDRNGNIKFNCTHGKYRDFSEGMCVVATSNWKYGYVDTQNRLLIPQKYDDAQPFCEGVARVKSNGKYGFINQKGDIVVPCQYSDAEKKCTEGMIAVCKNGKWGFVNKKGEIVISCIYDFAEPFCNGVARVSVNSGGSDKYGFVDCNGKDTF